HDATNSTQPNDAERFTLQLNADEFLALPLPGAQTRIRLWHPASERDQQRNRVLRSSNRITVRSIHHHYAASGGSRHIDVIDANAGSPDHTQVYGGIHHCRRNLGFAADHQALTAV